MSRDSRLDFVVEVVRRFDPPRTHFKPPEQPFLDHVFDDSLVVEKDGWTLYVPDEFTKRWRSLLIETKWALYWMAWEMNEALSGD